MALATMYEVARAFAIILGISVVAVCAIVIVLDH